MPKFAQNSASQSRSRWVAHAPYPLPIGDSTVKPPFAQPLQSATISVAVPRELSSCGLHLREDSANRDLPVLKDHALETNVDEKMLTNANGNVDIGTAEYQLHSSARSGTKVQAADHVHSARSSSSSHESHATIAWLGNWLSSSLSFPSSRNDAVQQDDPCQHPGLLEQVESDLHNFCTFSQHEQCGKVLLATCR